MADLVRSIGPSSAKPKVLVLRQQVRSVRPGDMPSRAPFLLALTIACVLAGAALVWGLGHLGHRLGFAEIVGAPQLGAEPGDGLAAGVRMVLGAPLVLFRAGRAEPALLMAGFVLIAIPAAALAAARRPRPGAPRPGRLETVLATMAAILAMALALGVPAWIASPLRGRWLSLLPASTVDSGAWLRGIDLAAGVDTLAFMTMILWSVLIYRLPIAAWLRALATVFILAATVVMALSWSTSASPAVELRRPRPIVTLVDSNGGTRGGGGGALLGYTRGHAALLRRSGDDLVIDYQPADIPMRTIDHASIARIMGGARE